MIAIRGGPVVTPVQTFDPGMVVIQDGRIIGVGPERAECIPEGATVVDATDRLVLPGLVDLHGDDIESHLSPRVDTTIDSTMALIAADRANIGHGITTKLHAIAYENAPDRNRLITTARELARSIDQQEDLLADNRIHLRCELADANIDAIEDLLGDVSVDLMSIMHHAPGEGQYGDVESFTTRYADGGVDVDQEIDQLIERRSSVPASEQVRRARRLATLAEERGIPLASHDDEHPALVERRSAMGVTICEYPITLAAARRATDLGQVTAMGAPNLVRGGSMWGNLRAERAIDAGILDILCSDYHPPSLLASIFVDTGEPLHRRVNRVSKNPAEAIGLLDRGRLEVGYRADLIIVDDTANPAVKRVFVDGVERLRIGPHR